MVELAGMAVASFQMATSALRVEPEKLGWILTEETRTRTPPVLRFCGWLAGVSASLRSCHCLTKLPARTVRVEAVWPSVQWAAVTTVRESRREPPQKWEPLRWRLTMKGKSPAAAVVPPTIWTESWGVGAAETVEAMRPAMSALYCILTKSLGVRGVSVGRGSASG